MPCAAGAAAAVPLCVCSVCWCIISALCMLCLRLPTLRRLLALHASRRAPHLSSATSSGFCSVMASAWCAMPGDAAHCTGSGAAGRSAAGTRLCSWAHPFRQDQGVLGLHAGVCPALPRAHVQHEEGGLVGRGDDQALLRRHLGPQVLGFHPRHIDPHKHGALRGHREGSVWGVGRGLLGGGVCCSGGVSGLGVVLGEPCQRGYTRNKKGGALCRLTPKRVPRREGLQSEWQGSRCLVRRCLACSVFLNATHRSAMVKRANGSGCGRPSRWRCSSSSISPMDTATLRA